MDAHRQCRRFSPIIALLLILQSTAILADFSNNFGAYPVGSQSCLNDAANGSGCNGNDVNAMNACLCGNGGNFILAAASCIGKSDNADLETVYTTMAAACSFSNTPMTVSQKDFLSAGAGTLSSSSSSKMTTTSSGPTSSPSLTTMTMTSAGHTTTITTTAGAPTNTGSSNDKSGDSNSSDGMSSTTRTAIIAGATVAGVVVLAVLAFFLIRMWRKRQGNEENRPMLGGDGGFGDASAHSGGLGSGAASGTELSHLSANNSNNTYDWKAAAVPDGSEAKWPHDPYLTTPSPAMYYQQHEQPAGAMYELPVQEPAQMPVEMPGTPMVMGSNTAYHQPYQPHELQSNPNAYR